MPATSKRVTKAMLEDLAVKQHKNLVERDKFLTAEEAKDFGLIDKVVEKRN